MSMRLEQADLETFMALLDEQNSTTSKADLDVMRQRINTLEAKTRTPLFTMQHAVLELTPAGHALYKHITHIRQLMECMHEALSAK